MPSAPPPPPPPPPPAQSSSKTPARTRTPPAVPTQGPPGAYLVELLIYDGRPFKDHWAYLVRSHTDPQKCAYIHAAGDVNKGFKLEVRRSYDFRFSSRRPSKIIRLQWVAAGSFNENSTYHNGTHKVDDRPLCDFEASAFKIKPPGKSLNSGATSGQKITQRNCQTWIVESADQLVKDGIFTREVAAFLRATQQ